LYNPDVSLRSLPFILAFAGVLAGEPLRVIFDTDMGNDVDDAVALAILHALESRGESKLLAITVTKDNPLAAPYIDLVDTFYGRPAIPIGAVRNGKTPQDAPMIRVPVEKKGPDGIPLYPRRLSDGRQAPEAVALLRKVLAAQPDGSVVVVQVGFSTNLARLLDSAPDDASPLSGLDLAKRKTKLLSVMAGRFPLGEPEYNVKIDIPAARKVFTDWPGPIVFSGWEVGNAMLFPASIVETEFGWAAHHPVVDAYRAYKKMPYDRQTWDPTSVLYAVRPNRGYFSLSAAGRVTVDDQGRTHFAVEANGPHRYLTVDEVQKARALEAMIALATQPR
jgi:inosine-uridine nucleoside N-ribohydrolase